MEKVDGLNLYKKESSKETGKAMVKKEARVIMACANSHSSWTSRLVFGTVTKMNEIFNNEINSTYITAVPVQNNNR